MRPERAFLFPGRAFRHVPEVATYMSGNADAEGEAHGQYQPPDEDNEGSEKDTAREVQVVSRNHNRNEENHESNAGGEPPRVRQPLTERPNQHPARQVLAEPCASQDDESGDNQSWNHQNEPLNQLS